MNNVRSSLPALSAMLLMAFAVPSYANVITGATGTVTCSSYSLEFTGIDLNPAVQYRVEFDFILTPLSGPAITIIGTVFIPLGTGPSFDVPTTAPLGPLTQNYTITASSATLVAAGVDQNTIPIGFGSAPVACGGTGSFCPATFVFWKGHVFPIAVKLGLTIGGVTYSVKDLLNILENAGNGNAITILGPQLVAALLNKAAGAVDNSTADGAITTAEDLLSMNNLNLLNSVVKPLSPLGEALMKPASLLDGYNSADFHSCNGHGSDIPGYDISRAKQN